MEVNCNSFEESKTQIRENVHTYNVLRMCGAT